MTLGNALAMNFYITKAELSGTDYYAVVTKYYADGTSVEKVIPYAEFVSYPNANGSMWRVTFDGIAAKEMSDRITVQIFNGKDQAVSQVWEDGIRTYLMRGINNNNFNEKGMVWAVECLNYGAASQVHFNYNTGDLANNQLTDAQKALGLDSVVVENKQVKGTNALGASLMLESNISLTAYFKAVPNAAGMTAKATFVDHYGDAKEQPFSADAGEFVIKSSMTGVVVDTMAAADARQLITVTMYNADGSVYGTITDSVESYAQRSGGAELYTAIMKFAQASFNMFH
jgi:hypothetical protein